MPVTVYTTILGEGACWSVDGTWDVAGWPNHITDHDAVVSLDITGPGGPISVRQLTIAEDGTLLNEPLDTITIGAGGLDLDGGMSPNGANTAALILQGDVTGTGGIVIGQIRALVSGDYSIASTLGFFQPAEIYLTGTAILRVGTLSEGSLASATNAWGVYLVDTSSLFVPAQRFNPADPLGDAGTRITISGNVTDLNADWSGFMGTLDLSTADSWLPFFGAPVGGTIDLDGCNLDLIASLDGTASAAAFFANSGTIRGHGHTISNVSVTALTADDAIDGGGNSGITFNGLSHRAFGLILGSDIW